MLRQIINIDEERCTGCGLCATACHEGAIAIVDGKARLMREDYCDGMGDCLPACPEDAISFETREAPAYDEAAVNAAKAEKLRALLKKERADFDGATIGNAQVPDGEPQQGQPARQEPAAHVHGQPCGCPGSALRTFARPQPVAWSVAAPAQIPAPSPAPTANSSQLGQWPCQIKLVPPTAPYFDGADLLIAADCCAYAYAQMHSQFMAGHITLIGCPKLDGVDYADKLAQILRAHDVHSITVCRMEVPCCGGLESAVRRAVEISGADIPFECVTIGVDGALLGREWKASLVSTH